MLSKPTRMLYLVNDKADPPFKPSIFIPGLIFELKYVIVSQSNDNCLQISHLLAFLGLKNKSFNLSEKSSFLIG